MYPVDVGITLRGTDRTLLLRREITMPVAPFPGLRLNELEGTNLVDHAIRRVSWQMDSERFSAILEDWRSRSLSANEMLKQFGTKWQRVEFGKEDTKAITEANANRDLPPVAFRVAEIKIQRRRKRK